MIIAERRGPKDALLVDVDSLDIEAKVSWDAQRGSVAR
jgi:hypothetical protein